MDLKRWSYFCAVAEAGSLARAAQAMEIAQSALSRQIALLEAACGGRLFHRTGRGVVLTRLGEAVQPKARALLEQADRLALEVREAANVPSGLVKLGVLPSAARVLVGELFEDLRRRAPGVRLHVMEAFTGLLDEYREAGRIDLSVMNRYRRTDPREEPLGTFDTYLVGPAGDHVTASETIEFRKLDRLPLVLPGLPSELRIRLEQHARELGIRLDIVLEMEALMTIRDVVAKGRIYTILPSYAVAQEVEHHTLSISRIVKPALRRVMCMDISTARPLSLATREVASAIRTISKRLVAEGTWPRSLQA